MEDFQLLLLLLVLARRAAVILRETDRPYADIRHSACNSPNSPAIPAPRPRALVPCERQAARAAAAAAAAAEPTHSGIVLLRYEIKGEVYNGRGSGGFRRDLLPSR